MDQNKLQPVLPLRLEKLYWNTIQVFENKTPLKEKRITAGVHTPKFNIDEKAIEIGMGMMACFGATVLLE